MFYNFKKLIFNVQDVPVISSVVLNKLFNICRGEGVKFYFRFTERYK